MNLVTAGRQHREGWTMSTLDALARDIRRTVVALREHTDNIPTRDAEWAIAMNATDAFEEAVHQTLDGMGLGMDDE